MSPLISPRCPQYQTLLRIRLLQTIRLRQPSVAGAILKNYQGDVIWVNNSCSSPTFSGQAQSSDRVLHSLRLSLFRDLQVFSVAEDLLLGLLGVELVVFTVPNYQLRTPLPTDCLTHIGVRGPSRESKSRRYTAPKRRVAASSQTSWVNEGGRSWYASPGNRRRAAPTAKKGCRRS